MLTTAWHIDKKLSALGLEGLVVSTHENDRQASIRSWLHRQRASKRIVTVEHAGQVLVPTFQLDQDLQPRPEVAVITAQLIGAGMDGWAVWAWWTGVNAVLEAAPVDLVAAGHADRVAAAADRLVDPQG